MSRSTHASARRRRLLRFATPALLAAGVIAGTLGLSEARHAANAEIQRWESTSHVATTTATPTTTRPTTAPAASERTSPTAATPTTSRSAATSSAVASTTAAPTTAAAPVTTAAPTTVAPATTAPASTTAGTPAPLDAAPAAPPAAAATPSPVALPPGATGRVQIPSIGMDLPVFRGGQRVIDLGVATWFDDGPGGWRDPVAPGQVGTHWLAGHQSSHGAPFRRVLELSIGDHVVITTADGTTYTYLLTERHVVGTRTTMSTVYGTDPSARRLLIQTCDGADVRVLYAGVLV